jgi:hypothetical protein
MRSRGNTVCCVLEQALLSFIRIFSIATAIINSSSDSDHPALSGWALMEIFVIIGTVVNVPSLPLKAPTLPAFILKLPERFWPGAFNYFFNSHQIMLIFSTIGLVPPPLPAAPCGSKRRTLTPPMALRSALFLSYHRFTASRRP